MKEEYGIVKVTTKYEETGLCFIAIDTDKKTLTKTYVNTMNVYVEELK